MGADCGPTPTPAPSLYTRTEGACRGGNSPDNNAGLAFFRHRNCKNLCDGQNTCTGYVLPKSNSNWCETYKSIGAKGDGRTSFWCYMKSSDDSSDETDPPTPTPTKRDD